MLNGERLKEKEEVTVKEVLKDSKYSKREMRFALSWQEWCVLARTLCFALYYDQMLSKKGMRFWDEDLADLQRNIAESLLDRLLILPRKHSQGIAAYYKRYGVNYQFRHPDYRKPKWHKVKDEKRESK